MPIAPLAGGNTTGSNTNWNGALRPCSFRGIQFPVESVNIDFGIALAQHTKPNVAGAKIEGLGRGPIAFHVKALFYNNLFRAPGETWGDSSLFPAVFQQVVAALFDDSAGEFVHPTLGSFNVKPVRGSSSTHANERNGQALDFELIEANTEDTDALLSTLELGLGYSSAAALDAQLAALTPAPPGLPTVSFAQLMSQITAIIDQTSLVVQQFNAIIDKLIFQLNRVEQSLDDLEDTSTAVIQQNVERVKSAANSLRGAAQKKFAQLGIYNTTLPVTLAQLGALLQNTPEQLLNLNPDLVKGSLVSAGTQVVYVKAA